MLRKILAILYKTRYHVLAFNLKLDRVKEPYRLFLAIAVCMPLFFCSVSKNIYAMNASLLGFVLIVGIRMYWFSWARKNLGGK